MFVGGGFQLCWVVLPNVCTLAGASVFRTVCFFTGSGDWCESFKERVESSVTPGFLDWANWMTLDATHWDVKYRRSSKSWERVKEFSLGQFLNVYLGHPDRDVFKEVVLIGQVWQEDGGKRTEGWGVSDWTDEWGRAYHRVAVKVGKDWKVEGSISWWGSGTGMLAVSGCVVGEGYLT